MKRPACLLLLPLFVGLAAAPAFAQGVQRATFRLEQALKAPDATQGQALVLSTTLEDGRWGWALGMGADYNRGLHRGRITGALGDGQLQIELDVTGYAWVPGGRARYDLQLAPTDAPDTYAGTYTGRFETVPGGGRPIGVAEIAGDVTVTLSPPQQAPANFIAPAPNEHPRLLFRKADLPALRAKAQTPLGKALVQRIEAQQKNPVALGMMYQLTGDAAYAQRAIPLVKAKMADESPGAFNGSDGAYAKRVGEVALAYDLCYDAWPAELQQAGAAYFAQRIEKMAFRPQSITRKVNQSPNSNYSGHLNGASGLAGLLIYNKPGPKPGAPRDPGTEPRVIAPPAGYEPGEGVPVEALALGRMPRQWLGAGPFPNEHAAHATPFTEDGQVTYPQAAGTAIDWMGVKTTLEPYPDNKYWDSAAGDKGGPGSRCFELMRATGQQFHHSLIYYTAVRVEKRQLVRYHDGLSGGSRVLTYFSGQSLVNGQYVVLEPGVHPMLIVAHLYKINPWGKAWINPHFVNTTEEAAAKGIAAARVRYELALARHDENTRFQADTGASAKFYWLANCGMTKAGWYLRYCFGDGGFQTEGEIYTAVGSFEPLLFAYTHRNVMGYDATGRPDASHFGPRYIAQTIYSSAGIEAHQSFSLTDGSLKGHRWAVCYPIAPDDWKPATLWAWNKSMGVQNGGAGKSAAQRSDDPAFIKQVAENNGDAVLTLVTYPLEVVPQNPNGILPKVWEAKTKGLYVFRNAWAGPGRDIVAQLFLKSEGEGGWQNKDGGALRLWGLGHAWTGRGPKAGKTTTRWGETVVMLPDDAINQGSRALKTAFSAQPDGSGAVTADMDLIYSGAKTLPNGKRARLANRMLTIDPSAIEDLGITGQRAFAADYSGKAGAEGLFAMLDQIAGGGPKVWQWQLDGPREQVTFHDDGFTLTKDGATLRATFLAPTNVKLGFAEKTISVLPAKDRAKTMKDVKLHAIHATDADDPTRPAATSSWSSH